MDGIAEIKFDQRGGAGRHRMQQCRTANLDRTLDVEANELFKARSGPEETSTVHCPTPFPCDREGAWPLLWQMDELLSRKGLRRRLRTLLPREPANKVVPCGAWADENPPNRKG